VADWSLQDDGDTKEDMKYWPFKAIEKCGKPSITTKHKGLNRNFVSFLSNIPGYFLTLLQAPEELSAMVLSKTKEIGTIACSAAIAYGLNMKKGESQITYDGTFDVSLLSIDGGEVLATAGVSEGFHNCAVNNLLKSYRCRCHQESPSSWQA
jgi:heat shock protein 5